MNIKCSSHNYSCWHSLFILCPKYRIRFIVMWFKLIDIVWNEPKTYSWFWFNCKSLQTFSLHIPFHTEFISPDWALTFYSVFDRKTMICVNTKFLSTWTHSEQQHIKFWNWRPLVESRDVLCRNNIRDYVHMSKWVLADM